MSLSHPPFKFQYDSINTKGGQHQRSIQSNFKFQYDSINTIAYCQTVPPLCSFKFQYDSINTCPRPEGQVEKESLNSNMILLILNTVGKEKEVTTVFKFQYDSINTLIRFIALCAFADFKFQYDSINTLSALSFLQVLSALNSNMILLIRIIGASLSFEKVL